MKDNLRYLPAGWEVASVDDIYREEPANDPYMVASIKTALRCATASKRQPVSKASVCRTSSPEPSPNILTGMNELRCRMRNRTKEAPGAAPHGNALIVVS